MTRQHVVIGLSGGVDSAVAAWLLREQGHRVSALFMVNWTEDESGYCSTAEDFQSARAVAEELDLPLHRIDFSREYRQRVFARFLADYAAGKTPNPDMLCNREIKFASFIEHARRLGANAVATGHYARLIPGEPTPRLLRATDENKDQTYFLALVPPTQLVDVRFPIGELTKPQVRDLARRAGLPNHRRQDSTGICFIGERPFRSFLQRYLAPEPGSIVDEHGRELGLHHGLAFYTLGQRRGISIGGVHGAREAPWYVIGKDPRQKRLLVSQNPEHPALLSHGIDIAAFHWLRRPIDLPKPLLARIRHRQPLQRCSLQVLIDGGVRIIFETPQRAAAVGQYAVIYDGLECLGGGEISATDAALPPMQANPHRSVRQPLV